MICLKFFEFTSKALAIWKYWLVIFRDLDLAALAKCWQTWKSAGVKSNPVKDSALKSLSSSSSFCIFVFTWNRFYMHYLPPAVCYDNVNYSQHFHLSQAECWIYKYGMVFTSQRFIEIALEIAIESWPEWDLNPWTLKSVQTL